MKRENIENPETGTLYIDVSEDNPFYKAYKVAESAFWVPEEFASALAADESMFPKLDPNIQHLVKNVIGFFLIGDGLINDSIQDNIDSRIQPRVLKFFYDFQKAMENIHNKCYSKLVDTYVKNTKERALMFDTLNNFPCIKKKVEWVKKQLNSTEFHKLSAETVDNIKMLKQNYLQMVSTAKNIGAVFEIPEQLQKMFDVLEIDKPALARQLLVNLVIEGIFFSASFCVIFWLNDNGLLPGLTKLNEFISRDEGMHCMFACLVYKLSIVYKLTQVEINTLFTSAVEVEDDFIDEAIHADLLGLSSKSMKQYIRFCADQWLIELGYQRLFKVTNPFDFTQKQSISVRQTDFFLDNNVTEYGIPRANSEIADQKLSGLDDDESDLSDFSDEDSSS